MGETKKQEFWQGVRGICILAVVFIHCSNGLAFEGMGAAAWNYHYWVVSRQLVDFAVGLFLFLSGYFTRQQNALANPAGYLKERLCRIGIPYVFWTLFYTAFSGAYSVLIAGNPYPLGKNLLRNFFLGESMPQMYFILVLLQLTLLTPMLLRCMEKPWLHRLCLCISPVCLMVYYLVLFRTGAYPPYYHVVFFPWLYFYYCGLWMRKKGISLKPPARRELGIAGATVIGALAICILEGYLMKWGGVTGAEITSQNRLSVLVYITALLWLIILLYRKGCKIPRWLARIGDASFGIYFVHTLVLQLVRAGGTRLPDGGWKAILPLVQLMEWAPTIVLSFLLVWAGKKLLGKKAAAWIGF